MDRYQKITPSMAERPNGQENQRVHRVGPYYAERLTRDQARTVSHTFGQHLRAGLKGNPLSLATINTYLHPVDKELLHEKQRVLVIEVGGTHNRGALVQPDSEKNMQIVKELTTPLSIEKAKKYASTDEFFNELAEDIKPVIGDNTPDAVGIIWSFPAPVAPVENGIDAFSPAILPKELVIPGIEKKPISDFIIEALQRNGIDIPSDIPRAVANDTAAVLLANGATMGGIVATGFNFAYLHNGTMYNLEAGSFSGVPQTALTQAVHMASDEPNQYLSEKQISGDYVGKAFNLVLHELGITYKTYTSADMSKVLSGELFADNPPVQETAAALRDRSAQLVGAMIAGAIREFPEDFPNQEIRIPIDGSFFGKTPGYKEAVEFYATDLLDNMKKITCDYVQQSGIKGAALAALGKIQK